MASLPPALVELIERATTDPTRSILVAAAELFAEEGIANVSLRAVAERAGVNYNYIHRHFGTKEALLVQLVHYWTQYGATFVDTSPDVHAAVRAIFQADPGRFAEILAWVALDGTDATTVFDDTTTVARLRELLEISWRGPSPASGTERDFDPRVVTAVVTHLVLTWDFYAPYMRALTAIDDRDPQDVHDEVLALMIRLIDASGPRDR
jgi:TetR/AcrR family transcriptional regulator, repressor for neighboring sulfatase